MRNYARTVEELKKKAIVFWPREIIERETSPRVLSLLLRTQSKFIGVLHISDAMPDSWKNAININVSDEITGNLFLKHLMFLSDLGVKSLKTLPPLNDYFKGGKMHYIWRKKKYEYQFKVIHKRVSLTHSLLRIDEEGLLKNCPIEPNMEDVIMLLLHGASSVNNTLPVNVKSRCVVGKLMGDSYSLDKYIKPLYMRVSEGF